MPIEALRTEFESNLSRLQFTPQASSQTSSLATEISSSHYYPLLAGGKRVRPLLVLLMAGAIGGRNALELSQHAACAVELVHTYSLVHDDLPCMDNDDLRRGKPTTHKVFGEAKALLVGDGLLTQAFFEISQTQWGDFRSFSAFLVETLAKAAGPTGMIWGQWLDISAPARSEIKWDDVALMHQYKTGCLLGACFEMGLLCGISVSNQDLSVNKIQSYRENAYTVGVCLGLAFQILDDILDVSQTKETLGKTPNKDFNQGKTTAVDALGILPAQELARDYYRKACNVLKSIFEDKVFSLNNEKEQYQTALFQFMEDLQCRMN